MFAFMVPNPNYTKTWSIEETKAYGEQNLRHARQIAEGGMKIARQYVEDRYRAMPTRDWDRADELKRKAMVEALAYPTLKAAFAIVKDGRPHYVMTDRGGDYLVVCWLHSEPGEKVNVGYVVWNEVSRAA